MASIGFIGLGHMGLPMASQLIQKSHTVYGFDLNPHAQAKFAQLGGHVLNKLEEFTDQQYIITMLQTGTQVHDTYLNQNGLFRTMPPETWFIDCSSIDVIDAQKLNKEATKHNINLIDAPVSGGVIGAETANLTFMVGATDSQFLKIKPILECMGQRIIHAGAATTGQVAKICNNMILGISMIAISEAFLLAEKLGLSAKKLHEIVTQSSGQCWAMNQYVPVAGILENVPANHEYRPGFASTMMLKDLKSSQHASELAKTPTPLGKLATEIYADVVNNGYGNFDFSIVIQNLKNNCIF